MSWYFYHLLEEHKTHNFFFKIGTVRNWLESSVIWNEDMTTRYIYTSTHMKIFNMHLPYDGHVLCNRHIVMKNKVSSLEKIIFWHLWQMWRDNKHGTKNGVIISETNNYGHSQMYNVIKTDWGWEQWIILGPVLEGIALAQSQIIDQEKIIENPEISLPIFGQAIIKIQCFQ